MKYLPLVTILLLTGCTTYDTRLADLELRQEYVYEVLRQRTLSPEKCNSYSIVGKMTCGLAENGGCACIFPQDQQDRENIAIAEALERAKATEEIATPPND